MGATKRCGTCKLWEPFYVSRPALGGKCMWVSTEVWPASTIDVPGVRRAVALFMDADAGAGCALWEPSALSGGSSKRGRQGALGLK